MNTTGWLYHACLFFSLRKIESLLISREDETQSCFSSIGWWSVCLQKLLIQTTFMDCNINNLWVQYAVINNAMCRANAQEILIDGWQRLILLGLISEGHKNSK